MTETTLPVIERFNEATNRHDVDGMMALMSDDVVFESTSAPDGERVEGQQAVRACWEELFRVSPNARFEAEEIIASDDRCTVRWRYLFDADRPEAGSRSRCRRLSSLERQNRCEALIREGLVVVQIEHALAANPELPIRDRLPRTGRDLSSAPYSAFGAVPPRTERRDRMTAFRHDPAIRNGTSACAVATRTGILFASPRRSH